MIDLTEAVDAAARARCAQNYPGSDFDDLPAMARHAFRELVAPIVAAAAPIIERAVAEDLAGAYGAGVLALGKMRTTRPDPSQPGRCPSIDPHDTLQCTRPIHDDDACRRSGGIAWRKGEPRHVGARERVALLERLIDEVAGRDS